MVEPCCVRRNCVEEESVSEERGQLGDEAVDLIADEVCCWPSECSRGWSIV